MLSLWVLFGVTFALVVVLWWWCTLICILFLLSIRQNRQDVIYGMSGRVGDIITGYLVNAAHTYLLVLYLYCVV